jgi:hypothetical protein
MVLVANTEATDYGYYCIFRYNQSGRNGKSIEEQDAVIQAKAMTI